jgi:stage II sporulation protein AA (anti-sigma F factor antagonist)
MEIVETEVDGILVLELLGDIDSTNAKDFTARLSEIVRGRQCNLVIDLQKIKYVSSAGFRGLLIVGQAIEDLQKKLVLCGMAAEVRRVFDIARFDELFVVCGSREEAIQNAK